MELSNWQRPVANTVLVGYQLGYGKLCELCIYCAYICIMHISEELAEYLNFLEYQSWISLIMVNVWPEYAETTLTHVGVKMLWYCHLSALQDTCYGFLGFVQASHFLPPPFPNKEWFNLWHLLFEETSIELSSCHECCNKSLHLLKPSSSVSSLDYSPF